MKIFITGISGLLGSNLALQVREGCEVSGCYLTHPIHLRGVDIVQQDVTDEKGLERVLCRVRPDVIVHTAGLTSVDGCEADPVSAHRVHVDGSRVVSQLSRDLSIRLVHLSTDHLFDGKQPWRTEEDAPYPLNVYARTKLESERVVLSARSDVLIIRTNFYGWGTSIRESFSDWIHRSIVESRPMRMFTDVYFTPIEINDLIDRMLDLIRAGAVGVFNVSGGERLSKYAFSLRLAAAFGLPPTGIQPIQLDQYDFKAPRPKDMSLLCRKAETFLRRPMPTVASGLARLRRLQEEGWSRTLREALVCGAEVLTRAQSISRV